MSDWSDYSKLKDCLDECLKGCSVDKNIIIPYYKMPTQIDEWIFEKFLVSDG